MSKAYIGVYQVSHLFRQTLGEDLSIRNRRQSHSHCSPWTWMNSKHFQTTLSCFLLVLPLAITTTWHFPNTDSLTRDIVFSLASYFSIPLLVLLLEAKCKFFCRFLANFFCGEAKSSDLTEFKVSTMFWCSSAYIWIILAGYTLSDKT